MAKKRTIRTIPQQRTPMREQPAQARVENFAEVVCGFTAEDANGAYDIITDTNLLPAICGRVCPQENQCEGVCTVGDTLEPVAIGRLDQPIL
jgi:glutamate synthase (NADPH/NADH) small chain